jgi:hypothetical protein
MLSLSNFKECVFFCFVGISLPVVIMALKEGKGKKKREEREKKKHHSLALAYP